jgi:rhamnosyltransferase
VNNEKIRIEVLLPAYNGEDFLAEQLDSILGQQGDFGLRITVRDDGSTDATREILRHYEAHHGIKVIWGTHIGVNASVMELINQADGTADLYAFSDQDDIWYDFRLKEAVEAFRTHRTHNPLPRPFLWTCMEELTDENLNPLCFMPRPKNLGDYRNAIIQNKTPGHTQVFNRALWELFKGYPPEEIYVYDWVLYLLASIFGEVYYCPRSCGKYRQHAANAIGYSTHWLAHLHRRAKRLFSGAMKGTFDQQAYFLKRYGERLPKDAKHLLVDFVNSRRNMFKRIRFVCTTQVKRDTRFESLQFRILYLLGVF